MHVSCGVEPNPWVTGDAIQAQLEATEARIRHLQEQVKTQFARKLSLMVKHRQVGALAREGRLVRFEAAAGGGGSCEEATEEEAACRSADADDTPRPVSIDQRLRLRAKEATAARAEGAVPVAAPTSRRSEGSGWRRVSFEAMPDGRHISRCVTLRTQTLTRRWAKLPQGRPPQLPPSSASPLAAVVWARVEQEGGGGVAELAPAAAPAVATIAATAVRAHDESQLERVQHGHVRGGGCEPTQFC